MASPSASAGAHQPWLGLGGKKAIVTGGASGLGKATVRELARQGVDVAIIDAREVDSGWECADECAMEAEGKSRCIFIRADVTNHDELIAAINRAAKEFGRVDILVNNAGGAMR